MTELQMNGVCKTGPEFGVAEADLPPLMKENPRLWAELS